MTNPESANPTSNSLRPAIFLDRDGVINENRPNYVQRWEHVRLIPGAHAALAALAQSEYAIVIVTNQSGIGRGVFSRAQADDVNQRLVALIAENHGRIDAVQLCPHRPDEYCACRKPQPGLLLQAAQELRLDLDRSWMVGDAVTDIQAGLAAGVEALLLRTGRGIAQAELLKSHGLAAVPVLDDLAAAVDYILAS